MKNVDIHVLVAKQPTLKAKIQYIVAPLIQSLAEHKWPLRYNRMASLNKKMTDYAFSNECEPVKTTTKRHFVHCRINLLMKFVFDKSEICVYTFGYIELKGLKFAQEGDELFIPVEPTKSLCLEKYRQAMENYNIGTFVPQCKPDGRYEEVQCGAGWDYCWCVDATGRELSGTKRRGWPTCGKIY